MRFHIISCALACAVAAQASAPLAVVATLPDMADFVRQVGGAEVEVSTIAAGTVDPHFFIPRPRHASILRRADLLVVGGMAIDVWVSSLIDSARNPRIRYGAPGYLDPAVGVTALEVPQGKIDGSRGCVHPFGNPHYWFTERNVRTLIDNITERLCTLRPEKAAYFRANAQRYLARASATFAELRGVLAPFKGAAIVQYHQSWTYFAQEFGLEIAGEIEPKPGIPPSAHHIGELIRTMRARNVRVILAEPYYPDAPLRTLSEATSAAALRVPLYLGARPDATEYLDNLRRTVHEIAAALRTHAA